jgi:hypothetical protein
MFNYQANILSCMKAVELFFDEFRNKPVLPNLDLYVPVEYAPNETKDGTIAFYFKDRQDVLGLEDRSIHTKGFQHASRYAAEVNS